MSPGGGGRGGGGKSSLVLPRQLRRLGCRGEQTESVQRLVGLRVQLGTSFRGYLLPREVSERMRVVGGGGGGGGEGPRCRLEARDAPPLPDPPRPA